MSTTNEQGRTRPRSPRRGGVVPGHPVHSEQFRAAGRWTAGLEGGGVRVADASFSEQANPVGRRPRRTGHGPAPINRFILERRKRPSPNSTATVTPVGGDRCLSGDGGAVRVAAVAEHGHGHVLQAAVVPDATSPGLPCHRQVTRLHRMLEELVAAAGLVEVGQPDGTALPTDAFATVSACTAGCGPSCSPRRSSAQVMPTNRSWTGCIFGDCLRSAPGPPCSLHMPDDNMRYARYWFQIVSAPYGGASSAYRIEPVGGSANEKSECQGGPSANTWFTRFAHDNSWMIGDRSTKRHPAVRSEATAEGNLFVSEQLAPEAGSEVERPADLRDHIAEVARKVNAADTSASPAYRSTVTWRYVSTRRGRNRHERKIDAGHGPSSTAAYTLGITVEQESGMIQHVFKINSTARRRRPRDSTRQRCSRRVRRRGGQDDRANRAVCA